MVEIKLKAYQALLSSAVLGTATTAAIALATLTPNRIWGILSGLPFAAIAGYAPALIHERCKLAGKDYVNGFNELAELLSPEIQQATDTVVRFIPKAIAIEDKRSDYSWISQSNRRFCLIFARPEKGKTQLALLKLEALIRDNPSGYHVRIVDFDYGKRGNIWGGFPKSAIIGAGEESESDIAKLEKAKIAIDEFHAEMVRRSAECAKSPKLQDDFPLWFLAIDEGASTIPALDDDRRQKISELIRRGPGYNFGGLVIAQNPAVGELGLSEAVKSYLDKLCVRPDHPNQLKEVLPASEAGPLVDRSLEAEKQGLRAAIWHSDYGTQFVYLPDRSSNPVSFRSAENAAEEWVNAIADWLAEQQVAGVTATEAWRQAIDSFPTGQEKKPKQLNSDPFYAAFKAAWYELESISTEEVA